MSSTAEEEIAGMLADGWLPFEHEHLKPGVRVHNKGEQYPEARQFGTAEVVAVVRKPGRWEEIYGRLNLEVLVKYDPGHSMFGGQLLWWADYGTRLTEGCFHCGNGPGDCEHRAAWAATKAGAHAD